MEFALLLSAVLMGLSGTPHCLAMCGAACGAITGRGGRAAGGWAFHLGRIAGYSAGGAVAASSVALLAGAGQAAAYLRPLWTVVHVLALGLGLHLLWRGRQPSWMERLGRSAGPRSGQVGAGRWQVMTGPLRKGAIGLAWVAWPCGLLQSALMVSALANTAWGGAMVMGGFAAASALGLILGPSLWWRLSGRSAAAIPAGAGSMTVRLAGLALVAASGWALGHGLWLRFWAWCVA